MKVGDKGDGIPVASGGSRPLATEWAGYVGALASPPETLRQWQDRMIESGHAVSAWDEQTDTGSRGPTWQQYQRAWCIARALSRGHR